MLISHVRKEVSHSDWLFVCKLKTTHEPCLGITIVRVCLHGGRGPQVGEVTRLGGVTRLSRYSLILI